MKAVESSPGGECKRTGNLCVCRLSPGHASEWQTCASIPLFLKKKSFTSGETPGPGLCKLYISIHNWWYGPRQTHYTCNMDSLMVSDDALVWTSLRPIIVCGGGMREGMCVPTSARERMQEHTCWVTVSFFLTNGFDCQLLIRFFNLQLFWSFIYFLFKRYCLFSSCACQDLQNS